MSLTSINETIWYLCKRSPGISAEYLMKLPFYEFMSYKMILDKELKAEQEQAEHAQREHQKIKPPNNKFKK